MGNTIRYAIAAALATTALPASQADAATLVVNVAGAQSFAAFGSGSNTVQTFDIGALSRVTAIAFNVSITAFDPSYLSEASLGFTGSDLNGDGVFFTPANGDDVSGTANYSGTANLVDRGLDFAVGTDGILRLEYFEAFNDADVSPDALWTAGTVTFTYDQVTAAVPEAATWLMMLTGFAMVGGAARYRRRATRIRYA